MRTEHGFFDTFRRCFRCRRSGAHQANVWQTAYKNICPKQKIENFDLAAQTQYFAHLAADSRVSLFVAEVQGKCAGYMAAGEKERCSVGQNGEILLLNLHSSCRGQGIGRALFAQGVACLCKRGFSSFVVACNKYNYPAQGFTAKWAENFLHWTKMCPTALCRRSIFAILCKTYLKTESTGRIL